MQPERWRQIETIFHAALRLEPVERAAYLAEACAADEELLREVESLVSSFESDDGLLAEPAFSLGLRVLTNEPAGPAAGQSVGPYKILGLLGKGGMGEVYLAKDPALGRKVALKLLPSSLTSDGARVHRFQQEARAAAAISHPNVAHIYGTGLADGRHYIAMEFVEGDTLRQKLAGGPLGLGEAVRIGLEIGAALGAAHERSIVHRDVKPENVMIRPDGQVKILDFGLAKLSEETMAQVASSPDTSAGQIVKTDPGMVMGTVRYMSPEQVRGQAADARTDVWSLGAVLFEMVAGRAPFEGPTTNDEIALILQREPPALRLPPGPDSAEFSRIVARALGKELERRYQSVEEFAGELRGLYALLQEAERSPQFGQAGVRGAASGARRAQTQTMPGTRGGATGASSAATRILSSAGHIISGIGQHKKETFSVVVVLALVSGYLLFNPQFLPDPRRPARPFEEMKITPLSNSGNVTAAATSPDGSRVAQVEDLGGRQVISVRHAQSGGVLTLEPGGDARYRGLVFSTDGGRLLYVRHEDGDHGSLYQASLSDGSFTKLLDGVDSPVSFAPDGRRFAFVRFKRREGEYSLMIANADGTGAYTLATKSAGSTFSVEGPAWSPDGKVIVCASGRWDGGHRMTLVGIDAEDGSETPVDARHWFSIQQVAWLGDQGGLVICAAERAMSPYQLWRVSYPHGDAVRITNDTADYGGVSLSDGARRLVTVQSNRISQVWVAPGGGAGGARAVVSKVGLSYGVAWTNDGRIVFSSMAGTNLNISSVRPDGSQWKQLTSGSGDNYHPALSGDGRYIIFSSNRTGAFNIWRMRAEDGGEPTQLTFSDGNFYPSSSPDNQWVFYDNQNGGKTTLWKVPLAGGEAAQVGSDYSRMPVVSPDGRHVAARHLIGEDRLGIAILPADGGPPVRLLPIPIVEWQRVQWTPDGKALTYIRTVEGVSNIWRYGLDGDQTSRLTDFGAERIYSYAWSRDFRQLACVRGTVISDVVEISNYR